jgi:membrane-associated phospholipid phosphatase
MSYREAASLEGAPRGVLPAKRASTLPRSLNKPLRWILGAAAACTLLVAVSVQLIDRPVATWVHQHLGDARFDWFKAHYEGQLLPVGPFSIMAGPAQALGPLAVVAFAVLAVAAVAGWRPQMRGRIILALTLAVFAALQVNRLMKSMFGRTWPESWLGDNPSWIRDGVFGFSFLHGGSGWGSFPSGHTAVITAPATILWIVWPELRGVWAAMVAIVIVGLIGGNYHFVSDIIGGLFLGAAVGLGIARLVLSPKDRLDRSVLRHRAPRQIPAAMPD